MKKKKGFTLVELLAVIAILAIILLIAVPMILGVIDESKEESYRLSVLGVFDAVDLEYAKTGKTSGNVADLPMNNNPFKHGKWDLDEDTETITITQVCDGSYKIGSLINTVGDDFAVLKDDGTCSFEIAITGNNPDNVSCSKTGTYTDQGAMYGKTKLTTTDTVDLSKAGTYQLHYHHEEADATRVVNVSNTNQPTLNIKETAVTIIKGDTFDANSYIESASDECEGDITDKVQSVSEVLTDIAGTYTVTYKVKNFGNVETTKTLTVTVIDLSKPTISIPSATGNNGWFNEATNIPLPENPDLDGYEYAISTDGGVTYTDYTFTTEDSFPLDVEGNNIVIKIRGKRGDKYTELYISDPIKMDTVAPRCTSSGGNTNWVKNLTITGTCNDATSGCVSPTVTKSFTTNTNTTTASPGSVRDNAGHTTVCPANQTVRVDTTTPGAPTVSGGGSTTWTTGNRTFTLTAPSSSSGIKNYEYYVSNSNAVPGANQAATGTGTTVTQNGKFVFFRAVNNAGTKGAWTAAKNNYIDKTTPAAPTIGGGATTWTSGNRTFTATAPSSTSGIKSYEYFVSNSNSVPAASQAATGTGLTVTVAGKFAFFRAVNNAGTKGVWTAAKNSYIDKSTRSITAKAASYTITQGTSNALPNAYFTVGGATISGGSVTCKIGSTTYTNTNNIPVGTHTLTCTTTTGAGVTKSASTTVVVKSNQYVACRRFACGCIECAGEADTILWAGDNDVDGWATGSSGCRSTDYGGYQKKTCNIDVNGNLTNCVITDHEGGLDLSQLGRRCY